MLQELVWWLLVKRFYRDKKPNSAISKFRKNDSKCSKARGKQFRQENNFSGTKPGTFANRVCRYWQADCK